MTDVCTVLGLPFDDGMRLGVVVISATKVSNKKKRSIRRGII